MIQIRSKHVGALLGLGVGWIIVEHGLVAGVFVGVAAALGWALGRVLDGELDLTDYLRRREREDIE